MSNGCNTVLGNVCGSLRAGEKHPSATLSSFELATASPAFVRLAAERFSLRCIRQYYLVRVLGNLIGQLHHPIDISLLI